MLLSAVVPYHLNSKESYFFEEWLPHCKEIELILVQDLHHDGSNLSLEYLIAKYPEIDITHISGYFHGPGGARKAGMAVATSSYIAFWDIDDLPNPTKFIEMTVIVSRANCFAGVGSFTQCKVDTNKMTLTDNHKYLSKNIFNIAVNPGIWRWVFLRNGISNIDFEDISLGEDQVFLQALNIYDNGFVKFDDVVYTYIKGWANQLTGSRGFQPDIIRAMTIMFKNCLKGGMQSKLFRTTMMLRLGITLIKSLLPSRPFLLGK